MVMFFMALLQQKEILVIVGHFILGTVSHLSYCLLPFCYSFVFCLLCRCGYRGGYCEAVNMDPDVFGMLMKSISAKLCPSVSGQVTAS